MFFTRPLLVRGAHVHHAGDDYEASLKEKHEPVPDPGLCRNNHAMCDNWAKAGECKGNPGYMLGSGSGQGACRLACGDCKECKEGDEACIIANREKGGYMSFDKAEFKGLL